MRSNMPRTCTAKSADSRLGSDVWGVAMAADQRGVSVQSGYFRYERKLATSFSFFCPRLLNDGMMLGPATSERRMAARGMRDPICVRSGASVPLPLSAILWHARHADCPTTSLPASYCFGTCRSTVVGGPAFAPL